MAQGIERLQSWGLRVELSEHAFDQLGHYLAGTDADRLADLNDAFRDSGVRAVMTTRGGKGSYRIANAIDFDAVRRTPNLWSVSVTSRSCTKPYTVTAASQPFTGRISVGASRTWGRSPPTACAGR